MDAAVRAEIAAAVLEIRPHGERLAVRSSADEDGSRHHLLASSTAFCMWRLRMLRIECSRSGAPR
jgi:hypothetical protein